MIAAPGGKYVAEANALRWLHGRSQDIAAPRLALQPCRAASTWSARCTLSGTFQSCGLPIRRDPRQISINLPSPLQQVVVGLETKPEPLRDSEIPCQPQVRIRGD